MANRVTISLDFELGWGAIETGMWRGREARNVYADLRARLAQFCAFLDEREIAMTWAMVGGANQPPGSQKFDHLPDNARIAAQDFVSSAKPQSQDGRDLLDQVLSMKTAQDVGSHSYSHTRFNWVGYDAAAKEEDVRLSRQALGNSGVDAGSFVYPLNIVDDHAIIERAGINVARLPPPMAQSRIGKLQERIGGAPPAAHHDRFSDKLTLETGSLLYVWGVRKDWRIRRWMTQRQAKRALARTAQGQGNMHMWLHPFNLVEVPELYCDLTSFLAKACALRDSGQIEFVPMANLAS